MNGDRLLDNFCSVFTGLVTLGLLLCSALAAQSILVIPGSSTDAGYSGGTTAYTIPQFVAFPALPPGTNSTLRYGVNFTYSLQVPVAGMYVLMLGFAEPTVQWPGQRVFSVWANDQPILQNLDVFAEVGYAKPLVKAAVVYIPGQLTLSFVASVRNAIVSLIVLTGVGIGDPPVAWCTGDPGCAGMGLTTLADQTGQPTKYFLIPTSSPFLYSSSFQ